MRDAFDTSMLVNSESHVDPEVNDKQKLLSNVNSNSEIKISTARTGLNSSIMPSHYSSVAALRGNAAEAPDRTLIEGEFKPLTPSKQDIEMTPVLESANQEMKSNKSNGSAGRDRIWGTKVSPRYKDSPVSSFVDDARQQNVKAPRTNSKSPREIAKQISRNHVRARSKSGNRSTTPLES